ncbi:MULTISPECIES: c-type cytochrome [Pseudomonas]|uniref:C-type cytochrome n=1 Tax=Pseudomonas sp. MYb327 TaxID=2745230 RepID=A0AAU8E3I7_9PSED|nr:MULTISPECIES: c-type cytochrome [Pseudomonas]PRA51988.1 cytochrome C [Pseudomonas sp. MYb115]QXN51353.1 c-type cytochrome [Pseudomonas fluorescens]WSO25671.1 c-type cytochrome [Pseudomonas fluorescens]
MRFAKLRQVILLCSVLPNLVLGAYPDMQDEIAAQPKAADLHYFTPRDLSRIPNDAFGDKVRKGYELFVDTQQLKGRYVGNTLNCTNCHLDAGTKAYAAPMWAAYLAYPAFRKKDNRVSNFAERIQGCFNYSMNGKAPAIGSPELVAMSAYSYWLLMGGLLDMYGMRDKPVPELNDTRLQLGGRDDSFVLPGPLTGQVKLAGREHMPGRAFAALQEPTQPASPLRGKQVYAQHCAVCHGEQGQGRLMAGVPVIPALWGPESYNWGAGMHRVNTAATFIFENMPLGKGVQLDVQQAWDVAAFMNSRERPQDPRFDGDLSRTTKAFHDSDQGYYGKTVDGAPLGSQAFPAGIQP